MTSPAPCKNGKERGTPQTQLFPIRELAPKIVRDSVRLAPGAEVPRCDVLRERRTSLPQDDKLSCGKTGERQPELRLPFDCYSLSLGVRLGQALARESERHFSARLKPRPVKRASRLGQPCGALLRPTARGRLSPRESIWCPRHCLPPLRKVEATSGRPSPLPRSRAKSKEPGAHKDGAPAFGMTEARGLESRPCTLTQAPLALGKN